ncbi:class I SAM-dependent methyltransferase [Neolewinella antarctica]|uniref:SAM-dependent methyltransferase n=1 Tax=Neolewinella antarctica TaxID=442734 RepID=A0ABX0X849_9BACT|nr:class I SAM-dependent methyltransferase [Neolewinella antarctica]NJC25154.1 SAM-dependent methyltransferase [Neolewinella antarctica]
MHQRHYDRRQYFDEQARTTREFVIPYINQSMPISAKTRVFEIGCGEGGNLVPFLKLGCACVGVDLLQSKIDLGKEYLRDVAPGAPVELVIQDIYDASADRLGQFDLIMLRDVIEHIHDQERFLTMVHRYLKPGGRIFFGFPPWRMPFGGHQQVLDNKYLSKLPWFHLLPRSVYKKILQLGGEKPGRIDDILEIQETGISIGEFSALIERTGFRFEQKDLWFINPNYQAKFGLRPRKLNGLLASIPWVKDYYTTCCYALVRAAQAGEN